MKIVNQTVIQLDGSTVILSDNNIRLIQTTFYGQHTEVSFSFDQFSTIAALVYGKQQIKEAITNVHINRDNELKKRQSLQSEVDRLRGDYE